MTKCKCLKSVPEGISAYFASIYNILVNQFSLWDFKRLQDKVARLTEPPVEPS